VIKLSKSKNRRWKLEDFRNSDGSSIIENHVFKTSMYIRCYKGGCRIQSVPLKKLKKLAQSKNKRWELDEDNWLILVAW